MTSIVRIANCSGFYGDRIEAAREMIDGGPIDVLTGDWLAELTMGVLHRQRQHDDSSGYARTFVTQMRDVLADCMERGIKIVSNAGGLNPRGCAQAIQAIADECGLSPRIACVDGDDITDLVNSDLSRGWDAPHLDTGAPFSMLAAEAEVASAYLGAWGIVEALNAGADIVITGRVSDASVIVGPAAWHHQWARTDWDRLAGAVAAGHIIECGAQTCGGNFSFFAEIPDMEHPGFPIAEIYADGSSVITKHPGTGGAVTTETVTAQLLYEIDGPRYLNPDVVALFDTLRLDDVGPDRVRVSGCQGEPAPPTTKVGLICTPGWRNAMTFVITGSQAKRKAAVAQQALWSLIPGGRDAFDDVDVRLIEGDSDTQEKISLLTIAVSAAHRALVDSFSRRVVETALSTYPGMYLSTPPTPASQYTVFWPTLVDSARLAQRVEVDGQLVFIEPTDPHLPPKQSTPAPSPTPLAHDRPNSSIPTDTTLELCELGHLVGSRSGDKGGNATLGLWARSDATHHWLDQWFDEQAVARLVPDAADHELRFWALPNIRAVGVTIVGLLGLGVAANLRLDSQAKGLGESVRARLVDVPERLLDNERPQSLAKQGVHHD